MVVRALASRKFAMSRHQVPDDILYRYLYAPAKAPRVRRAEFRGGALRDLQAFPATARREAGHQIDQVQHGREPDDWKPMNSVGQGVQEIRIHNDGGAFRVMYVAKFANTVYVLHCFQKKTQKTGKRDLDVAAKRYRDLLDELRQ